MDRLQDVIDALDRELLMLRSDLDATRGEISGRAWDGSGLSSEALTIAGIQEQTESWKAPGSEC